MNTWVSPIKVWNGDPNASNLVIYKKESFITRPGPANLWLFIDENPSGINDGSFICDPQIQNWIDYPASYHNGAGGMAFADGHAEIHKWNGPVMNAHLNVTYTVVQRLSCSINDPDMLWLAQHTPEN